jgi:hypothetical protein
MLPLILVLFILPVAIIAAAVLLAAATPRRKL